MILYAVLCRAKDAAVLAECLDAHVKSNVGTVTVSLMEHLRDHPEQIQDGDLKTFVQRNQAETDFFAHFLEACTTAFDDDEELAVLDEHYFHLYYKDGVFYCCLGDDPDTRDQKVNFAFLDQVRKDFCAKYSRNRIATAHAYAMDKKFKPTLRSLMHHYTVNATDIARDAKCRELLAQVEDMKVVLGRSINLMMENSENLDSLLDKSEVMKQDAKVFKKRSAIVLRKQRRRRFCMYAGSVFAILLIGMFVVTGICGFGLQYCRVQIGNDNDDGDDGGNANGGR